MNRRTLFTLVPAAGAAVAALASPAAAGPSENTGATPVHTYMRLPSVNGTVMRTNGQRAVMTVEIGLDVKDEELRLKVTGEQPRLIAAYNEVIQRTAAGLSSGFAPDVDALHAQLQRATTRTLGRGGAIFLIGSVTVL